MKIHTFLFATALLITCSCGTQQFTKDSGDAGQFILQQATRYGGIPTVTNGLPVVTTHWKYLEDEFGMQIHLPANAYPELEAFLNQAFAGAPQFGPAGSADKRTRIHEYRITVKGGGIQLSEQEAETVVVVLRSPRVSK